MLKSLRRITSNGKFVPEIDAMRFFAILPVVLLHANTNYLRYFEADDGYIQSLLNKTIHHGMFGVYLFFAISGFVLSNNFADFYLLKKGELKQYPFKQYCLRRLTRLEPPFIISTIILFFFVGFYVVGNIYDIIPNLLATLGYAHYLVYGKWSVVNPVTWSLEIEIQFYLIAPLLGRLFFSKLKKTWRFAVLGILIILSPLMSYTVISKISNLSHILPMYFSYFLVGILMTAIYKSEKWSSFKPNYFLDILGCAAIFGFYTIPIYTYAQKLVFCLCLILFMLASFKGILFNKLMRVPIIGIIGGMCYSIYLIHYATIFGLMKMMKRFQFQSFYLNWSINMGLSLLLVMLLSVLFYKYCERPFMDKEWYLKWVGKLKNG